MTTGYLQADYTKGAARIGERAFSASTAGRLPSLSRFRSASAGIRSDTLTRLLLRSVGAEFKVMQELMRHSTLRTTMDVYTQAVAPAKHAAQAAVLALFFPISVSDEEEVIFGTA